MGVVAALLVVSIKIVASQERKATHFVIGHQLQGFDPLVYAFALVVPCLMAAVGGFGLLPSFGVAAWSWFR